MKTTTGILLSLLVPATILSCHSNTAVTAEDSYAEIINIDNAEYHDKLLLSSIADTPTVVILETKKECAIKSINSLEVFEDKIYILDGRADALYVFDKSGRFINQIGNKGHGRGEHLELEDFSIDRKRGEIYLWDNAACKALKYNIRTNEYMGDIKTQRNGSSSFCMQFFNDKLFINKTSRNNLPDNYMMKVVDVNTGSQTDNHLNADIYNNGWNLPLRYKSTFFYVKNTDAPKYIGMFSNFIISITKDGPVPAYEVRSKDFVTHDDLKPIIESAVKDNDYKPMELLHKKELMYSINEYVELKGKLAFNITKGGSSLYVIYDKEKQKAIASECLTNDYVLENGRFPLNLCYSDKEGVWALLPPEYVHYFIDNIVSNGLLKSNLHQYNRIKNLKKGSNPILFYHKLK